MNSSSSSSFYFDSDSLFFSCVDFLPPPDDIAFLRTAHDIFIKYQKIPDALAVAIRLGDRAMIEADFRAPANPSVANVHCHY